MQFHGMHASHAAAWSLQWGLRAGGGRGATVRGPALLAGILVPAAPISGRGAGSRACDAVGCQPAPQPTHHSGLYRSTPQYARNGHVDASSANDALEPGTRTLHPQNGLEKKVDKSRKQMKERRKRAKKVRGVKKSGGAGEWQHGQRGGNTGVGAGKPRYNTAKRKTERPAPTPCGAWGREDGTRALVHDVGGGGGV